jgi:sulfate adenylyltransferase subunit 2
MNYSLNHLEQLESEAIYIFREVAEQFEKIGILFSGGKDSIVMVHLAIRAFWPAKIPFNLIHVDTGHNFPETIEFRDNFVKNNELNLIVALVEDSIRSGAAVEEKGPQASRNSLQSITLLETIEKLDLDACFGGARRDEEKSRAKERIFSHRNEFGEWDPKNQRPEIWSQYNGRKTTGENFRIFPLSNWTELDVWNYIKWKQLDIPSIYYSHNRKVFERNGAIYAHADFMTLMNNEIVEEKVVRFRTIGDVSCTGAIESTASNIDEVINEITSLKTSERGTRMDDQKSETAMEDRKKQGYF